MRFQARSIGSSVRAVDFPAGWFGALRLRHLGPRTLIEDGSEASDSISLVNRKADYRFTKQLPVELDLLNLLDSKDDNITYYYASRFQE
jgi:hypothetical protein